MARRGRRLARAGDQALEGFRGLWLVRADLAAGDGGDVEVFALDGRTGEPAEHGELADVGESVCDGTLEEAVGGRLEGCSGGEERVKGCEGSEEALLLRGPGERLRVMPALAALGDGECPIEEVSHVGEDLDGAAARAIIIGERRGSVLNRAVCAVGERGKGMAEKSALVVHGEKYS